ncbi:hypothetical protein [Planococcus sp. CAU13]|uniref:hypothetical protein n=1 Tax=Planococcus sp. CAU13 TaxID=1541197 RepID=UPI0005300832|nr:hypothetical protein [Planococcus sp. CAU13]
MQDLVEKMTAALPSLHFEKYWNGFQEGAFALYDEHDVYLFNHPDCSENPYISFPKDDRFVSCTSIIYADIPTAIVDIRYFDNFEDIYSLIVHESFHAYQNSLSESRFPDEAIGPSFPADSQFIQLRIRERKALHDAVHESPKDTQIQLINEVISLRDERIRLFPAVVDYENRVETIEGPAFYVEYQALRDISNSETALERYAHMLLDAEDSHLHIRKSCYSSGLFLCLLLDQLSSGWQKEFVHSELDLFHFFKSRYSAYTPAAIADSGDKEEAERIVSSIQHQKTEAFQAFDAQPGIRLTLTGSMQVAGFDPMNLVIWDKQALHKHFLKIRIDSAEYFIKGLVLTEFNKDFRKINTLSVFREHPPVETDNVLHIEGIGQIGGNIDSADDKSVSISLQ